MTTATQIERLHIGGTEPREGWTILDIQDRDGVDIVGDICDMQQIATDSVGEIYACHILEHLSYQGELQKALKECRRVLKPGGVMRISVPDLSVLCALFAASNDESGRVYLMRVIYGGATNEFDHHKTGFTLGILGGFLSAAGFAEMEVVDGFGMFDDCSGIAVNGQLISLNVVVT